MLKRTSTNVIPINRLNQDSKLQSSPAARILDNYRKWANVYSATIKQEYTPELGQKSQRMERGNYKMHIERAPINGTAALLWVVDPGPRNQGAAVGTAMQASLSPHPGAGASQAHRAEKQDAALLCHLALDKSACSQWGVLHWNQESQIQIQTGDLGSPYLRKPNFIH